MKAETVVLGKADNSGMKQISVQPYVTDLPALRDKYMVSVQISAASVTMHSVTVDELRTLAFALNAIVEDAERTTTEKAA